jgi:hypothetical protein
MAVQLGGVIQKRRQCGGVVVVAVAQNDRLEGANPEGGGVVGGDAGLAGIKEQSVDGGCKPPLGGEPLRP